MAYFSNGTEGLDYQERYCFRCQHWDERVGCPIWLAHELFAYQLCNSKEPGKEILDLLIPEKDGFADRCALFLQKPPTDAPSGLQAPAVDSERQTAQGEPNPPLAAPDGPGIYDVTWSNGEQETVTVEDRNGSLYYCSAKAPLNLYPIGNGYFGRWRRA